MKPLSYTLIADGSSDKTLLRIINWSFDKFYPDLPTDGKFASFHNFRNPPKQLLEKVTFAGNYYPFDILFVHRDAEKMNSDIIDQRINEIIIELVPELVIKTVCVIPVKMMETWLLLEKDAIKRAAGNRNYKGTISLPPINRLEKESQPKEKLHQLLREISGLKGRNLKKFNPDVAVHLVAEFTQDFSPLRKLNAFQVFENNLKRCVDHYLNIQTP